MNSTMPAFGRDLDSRFAATSVVTLTVSPSKSGAGKRTSVMPRLAMVVPTVVSLTEMPIISPSVKSEFISGRPHSVSVAQKCASMWSGCGFSVMFENSMLSICVTVRVSRCADQRADGEVLEVEAAARMRRGASVRLMAGILSARAPRRRR